MTIWHITFGTYGDRLHGDDRPTVDRHHNVFGTPFLDSNPDRNERERAMLRHPIVQLSDEQQAFVQGVIPSVCARGGWTYIDCAAGPNHVHVLLGVDPAIHGKQVRRWLKRWLSEALDSRWPRQGGEVWWAECGSTKAVKDESYRLNAIRYVNNQRAPDRHGPAHE